MTKGSYPNCYILPSLCIICLGLAGCGQSIAVTPPSSPPLNTPLKTQLSAEQPQFLPIEGNAQLAGKTIQLEVARSPAQQAKGMMWRREPLPNDRGMVFPFPQPQYLAFWMKNCFVPLDMVFINAGKVVAIETADPCTKDPCPVYPRQPVLGDTVIELRAGWAKDYGLKVGDRVQIQID